MSIRLCKDGRWAALDEKRITGQPVKARQLSCYEARYFDDGRRCGPQGRYWEAR
jgi:hypothetical protein